MRHIRILAAGIGLQMAAGAVLANSGLALSAQAQRLLDSGHTAQAIMLLEGDLLKSAGNADFDYLLGLAYLRAGKAGEALFAFERVAMVDPDNTDARLKAAQINLDRGDALAARELLAPLSQRELPAAQQQEREQIRAGIANAVRAEGIALRGYVLAGIGRDDNVTSGPGKSALLIPGLGAAPTALGTAARAADSVGILEAGLSLFKAVDADSWLVANGNLGQGFNRLRDDVKESSVNFDLGIYQHNGNNVFGATLLAQDYLLSNKVYRHSRGVRVNWIRPVSARSRLNGYIQYLDFDFPDSAIDNAVRQFAGLTHEGTADGSTRLWQYGLYGGKETAKDSSKPHFSFDLWGAHVGTSLPLNDKLSVSAGMVFEAHQHQARDPLYFVTRRDTMRSFGVAADVKLGERWHLIPRYTYTRNASNTELYDYARNTLSLQLKWDFDNAKN